MKLIMVRAGGYPDLPQYAVGMSYGLWETLRLGVELKRSEHAQYFGPVIFHIRMITGVGL